MRVAVVPAAGKGTRFYELGNNYAKTLLPFDGVPILERIIEKLSPDFDEIRIVVSENSDQIETFLQELNEPKVRVLKVPSLAWGLQQKLFPLLKLLTERY